MRRRQDSEANFRVVLDEREASVNDRFEDLRRAIVAIAVDAKKSAQDIPSRPPTSVTPPPPPTRIPPHGR